MNIETIRLVLKEWKIEFTEENFISNGFWGKRIVFSKRWLKQLTYYCL